MAITAQDVNKLRQLTGAGMMDCKKALTEAEGDFDKAIEILRKQGQKVAAKRADNAVSEGVVVVEISSDESNGKLVALACETEPVANVADFKELAKTILGEAVANDHKSVESLMAATLSDGSTVADQIVNLTGKLGEKIEIVGYENVSAQKVVPYIHSNGKLGVLVAFEGGSGADLQVVGRDIAMQIAAMRPVALDKDGVDAALVEREIEIGKEQARAEGKPEAMLERIAQGKLQKFYKDNTLLNQEFVKDSSLTIRQLLEKTAKDLSIVSFKRVGIGN
ncbi:translation elongation factor Ts [Ravibacter arvi]|uniref:Elongation factor Ts n=1 Tax=Ravibacter arvi TaxID=2051041 RepID=A0ABP8M955_9BACT